VKIVVLQIPRAACPGQHLGYSSAYKCVHLLFLSTGVLQLWCTGATQPKGAQASKERERGRRVEGDKFGPLKEWRVLYSKAGPQVRGVSQHALLRLLYEVDTRMFKGLNLLEL